MKKQLILEQRALMEPITVQELPAYQLAVLYDIFNGKYDDCVHLFIKGKIVSVNVKINDDLTKEVQN